MVKQLLNKEEIIGKSIKDISVFLERQFIFFKDDSFCVYRISEETLVFDELPFTTKDPFILKKIGMDQITE